VCWVEPLGSLGPSFYLFAQVDHNVGKFPPFKSLSVGHSHNGTMAVGKGEEVQRGDEAQWWWITRDLLICMVAQRLNLQSS
jgi:hypothetical protein